MTAPLVVPVTTVDPRVAVVAEAMVAYDSERPEKTWRELAAVAIAVLDRWHALNDPRISLTPSPVGPDIRSPFLNEDQS